jgi:hypothetical protein
LSVEEAFAALLGRHASAEERERLHRVRDALHLGDNDALWLIVLALEHYDATFRRYPEQLREVTRTTLEETRRAYATAAAQEAARAQRVLSERVVEASREMAKRLAEQPFSWTMATLAMAAVVAFGALCVAAGYTLSSPTRPFWVRAPASDGIGEVLSVVLGVPAGWMMLVLVLPALLHVGRGGWEVAAEPDAQLATKAGGWTLVVLSVLTAIACAAALARLFDGP